MYTLLIAIIYLAFVSLGLPDSLLGSAWPIMHQEINASISFMGAICVIVSLSTIASSLLSHRLTKKFGTKWVTTISIFISAIALLGFSYCKSIWSILVFAIPYGLGAGGIDAALNNYVAIHYNSKHMSWLHCMWGVGASIGPYIMGYALNVNHSWNKGYFYIFLIQISLAICLFLTLSKWQQNDESIDEELGDLLFAAVNLARFRRRASADELLRNSCRKFVDRFQAMEKIFAGDNRKCAAESGV